MKRLHHTIIRRLQLANERTLITMRALIVGCCLLLASSLAQAEKVTLEIALPNQHQLLALSDLLRHPAIRTITIPFDVAYKQAMQYRAIPLRAILRDVRAIKTIQFKAQDGFVATIPAQLLYGAAEPWLAIEPPNAAWPPLKADGRSAGPFYLVWIAPEKSAITPEQWPYQISAIREVLPLEQRYPQILPDAALSIDSADYRGMQTYIKQCASCHQINHGGDATIGPDLNLPFNPTEYFQPEYLRKYIRDPASVRYWPQMNMPGFSQGVMDDAQLDDLLVYLRNMRTHKEVTTKTTAEMKIKVTADTSEKNDTPPPSEVKPALPSSP